MADIVSPERRSKNMSAIRSKDTKPEIYLRKLLFAEGYRYRIAEKSIPGHPDMFLRKYNTAIFVHGCFWHRHGCKDSTMPKSNVKFWMEKWSKNVKRDKRNEKSWKDEGWNVITVWGCALESMKRERTLLRICECLSVWAEEAALGKKRRTPHRLTLPRMP